MTATATVDFWLSAGAGYISGATIQVDGGKYMHGPRVAPGYRPG